MYTSLVFIGPCLIGCTPPNKTAWCSSIMVKEKELQGGGLAPKTSGEDHAPNTKAKVARVFMWVRTIYIGD